MPASLAEYEFESLWDLETNFAYPLDSTDNTLIPWRGTGRKFRGDFVYPPAKVIIEIQGAVWTKGGHSTGTGITRDALKSALALANGWVTILIPTTAYDTMIPIAAAIIEQRVRDIIRLSSFTDVLPDRTS
jgi:hypothetical protein